MIRRIGTVISAARDRARVLFDVEGSRDSTEAAPSACCRPATDAGGEQLEAASGIALQRGDRVEVLVPEPRSLGARLVPLLAAVIVTISGAIAGGLLWGDAGTGIGIGVGLFLGVALAVLAARHARNGASGKPQVLRVIDRAVTVGRCDACAAAPERR